MANQPKKYQKFVATAATATLVATAVVPAASAADTTFSDISTYATAVQEEVLFLADLGVINGFEDGTFKPSQNITRGQAVKMIGRFLEAQGFEAPENWATEQSFSDIAVDRTDRDLVKYAALVKEVGVFQGNGNVLNPSGFTTRENMALILDRLIGQLIGKTAVELAEGLENNVSDLANAKEEAREAIAALNALGVSNAEEFKPKNNTQRVHFASFLARMIELADQQAAEPAIESVEALSKTKVVVTFNTPVDEVTAENFTIEGAVVNGVELSEDKTVATLDVSGLEYNTEYTVAVADVKVEGEAVDFGSQSFTTPAVTQDFELRVTAAEAEVVADGADNVVIKFELLNSLGEVDTNADNMVLEIGSTFGNLATNRVTIQDGVGQVVLSSEFSSKELIAKVTAQVIEASTDYKDLIGKIVGETTVKFIPAASVLDPNALTFLGAESNQADRVVVYFDKPVSPATFVETEEDGSFKTVIAEEFNNVERQIFKTGVEFGISQDGSTKGILGLAAVPGNDKAIEVILAKEVVGSEKPNILKDNAQVDLVVKIGETRNDRSFTLTDSRKPEFTGVTVSNLRTLDLKFSEAVVDGKFSIDGRWTQGKDNEFIVEFGEFDAATGIDKRDTATVSLNKGDDAKQLYFQAGQHSITVTQLKDFAADTDNANISSTQTLNFDVFADLTAPTATAEVESPEQFRVTFNKDFGITSEYISDTAAALKDAGKDDSNFKIVPGETDEQLNKKAIAQLSYIFNDTLRVYDAVNKDWVTLDKLTVDGKTASAKVFNEHALKELLAKHQLLVAKQASDENGLVNEVVVELKEDWTKLFTNERDTYHNYQFKFDIDARTFENAANGIMNSSFDLNLNYEGSPLNTADNTSPVIDDIKQTKDKSVFEVFLNEPVKLRDNKDEAGDTPSTTQEPNGVPTVLVEFQGKDADGKAVVVDAQVDGYSSTTDKDGDSVLRISTPKNKETLQQLVDSGYDANWKVVVRSVSDDIGNTAATLTKDFSLVPNTVERPFHIESPENVNPLTGKKYENQVFAIDAPANSTTEKDRLEVTFTKAVNFAGNDNLTSVYNWTLNGTKLSELSNVESIKLADVRGSENDYEKVIITFADGRAFGDSSNVISVTKGIKSLDGTVLTGEYEVVADTLTENELTDLLKARTAQALIDAANNAKKPVLPANATDEQKADYENELAAYKTQVSNAVKAYNALTNAQKGFVPAEKVQKLTETAEEAGVEEKPELPPTEGGGTPPPPPNPAPVVTTDSASLVIPVVTEYVVKDIIDGEILTIPSGKAIPVGKLTFPEGAKITVDGNEADFNVDNNGNTVVRVDVDTVTSDSKIVVSADEERVTVDYTKNEATIKLLATDDLATLADAATGTLSENATANVKTATGEFSVELTTENPIGQILDELNKRGVTAADLIGKEYTVTLIDKQDNNVKTVYTLKF